MTLSNTSTEDTEPVHGLVNINEVTIGLINDLKALRAGKITNTDARVRANLGREILRSIHIQLEASKYVNSMLPDRTEGEGDDSSTA